VEADPEACLQTWQPVGSELEALGNTMPTSRCCAALDNLKFVPIRRTPGVLKRS